MQKAFKKQVQSLSTTTKEIGDPFQESTNDLLVLDTQDIKLPSVVETVKTLESVGQNQYREFVTEILKAKSNSLFEPIKQNKLPLFSSHPLKSKSKKKLFSQLYVSCQVRDGNLDTFFGHENQEVQEQNQIYISQNDRPDVDMLLLDGAVIVNMLRPRAVETFHEYSQQVFLPLPDECSRIRRSQTSGKNF